MIEPKPIASLEPGKRYVIKTPRFHTEEEFERFREDLQRQAPECQFLILDKRIELVGEAHHCKDCKQFVQKFANKNFGSCKLAEDDRSELFGAFGLGSSGALWVSPEFGCIQFEAKEQG